MEICAECDKEATSKCAICGKSLCNEHITYGISMRTNAHAVNCPRCQEKFPKKMRKTSIIMVIGLIIIAIFLIYILSIIIPFLR